MVNQRIREVFNDGNLTIQRQTTRRNELKKKVGTSYAIVAGPLRFKSLSIRDSDLTTMDAMGSKLSRKVKTPFHPVANKFNKDKYFIVIEETRYNVIYVDYDNYYLYLYLEKVGEFFEREREDTSDETDG